MEGVGVEDTSITKTCLYNVDSLKPHFYIVKMGLQLYIIFLISAQKHRSMFLAELWKISEFISENFHFLVLKFSVYLNRLVFVMGLQRLIQDDFWGVPVDQITVFTLFIRKDGPKQTV